MNVTRVWEAPRVTKPYSEEQWSAIDSLGRLVDEHLSEDDVRLTMGGEPRSSPGKIRLHRSGTPRRSARTSARCQRNCSSG